MADVYLDMYDKMQDTRILIGLARTRVDAARRGG
jgi:hypothetical protein